MGDLFRRQFLRGWVPTASEAVTPFRSPITQAGEILLRADNLQLDEEGLIGLRFGSAKINGAVYADHDVHSLFSVLIAGTRYRYAGVNNSVYLNDVKQSAAYDGSNDISFESWLGFVLAGRATTHKKYHPTFGELNWGIKGPSSAPVVTPIAAYTAVIASCATAEAPAFVANEGVITGVFPTGADGSANGAIEVTPAAATGRATITKTFASDQDFFNIQSRGDDQDLFDMMARVGEPEKVETITVMLGMDTGADPFQDNYYYFDFKLGGPRPNVVNLRPPPEVVHKKRNKDNDNGPVSVNLPEKPVKFVEPTESTIARMRDQNDERRRERKDKAGSGWTHLTCLRAQFNRVGSTVGRNWTTIRAVKLVYKGIAGATGTIQYDAILMIGGTGFRALTGKFRFKWAVARFFNDAAGQGVMVEMSPASAASDEVELVGQGARISLARDLIKALDPQVQTEGRILIYFFGGFLDQYYLASHTGILPLKGTSGGFPYGIDEWAPQDVDGAFSMSDYTRIVTQDLGLAEPVDLTGPLTIDLVTNDVQALIANEFLMEDLETPPDYVVDIEGPHHDRMFVLVQNAANRALLYISEQRRPGAFRTRRILDIGDATETAFWLARTIGAIYVGTSEDIYAITGDGTETPDGLINFTKQPLNIGSPPTDQTIAVEGNQIMYRAADGPRIFDGVNSVPVPREDVDLLYKGQTRHGVSPPNLSGGRFRAALSNQVLYIITPEGASTTKSSVLHCYDFRKAKWRRYTYPVSFRSIVREIDGSVILGDENGQLWLLNSGTDDGGTLIPVVMWTAVDDNSAPLNRKDPYDIMLKMDTGVAAATVNLHLDGSAAAAAPTPFFPSNVGMTIYKKDLSAMAAFRQLQMRLTGSFSTFRFYEMAMNYRLRSQHRMFVDTGYIPILKGSRFGWVDEIEILASSPANLTVTCYFDGVQAEAPSTVVVTADVMRPYRIKLGRGILGRQGRVTIATTSAAGTGEVGFECLWVRWKIAPRGGVTEKSKQYMLPEQAAQA